MRSVLLVEEHPVGAGGGVALRNRTALDALARLGRLVVVDAGATAGDAPVSGAGEARVVGLEQPPGGDPDEHLRRGGHPADSRWSPGADARWRALLAQEQPDVVVVEQLWLSAAFPAARDAGARTVLDAHNVEAEVYAAIAATGPVDRADLDAAMAERTRLLEQRVVAEVDQVWVCSEADREGLGPTAVVVPNVVDVQGTPLRDPALREHLVVYPASFAYPPNARAARTLVEQVLPAFGGRLALVGHSPPRWLRELDDPRVDVPGRVPAVRPWLERACAVVVPLTEGGGTRFKVLEAMAAGVPVISTAKGVEGLDLDDAVLVTEDPVRMGELAAGLWRDGGGGLAARARALVEERYSWDVAAAAVEHALSLLG